MQIEPTQLDKAVLLKVTGRMDAESAPEFEQACEQWIAQGCPACDRRAERVAICQQHGIAIVPYGRAEAEVADGSLTLCGLQGLPRQVFEMTRLIGLFPVYQSTDEAIAKL